jgi:hypothetical protein
VKRTRIKPKRPVARRRLAPRWNTEDWAEANQILWGRANGCCERCGRPIGESAERHHRQRREVGGDRLANLLLLHSECHAWITEHPEAAQEAGWIVSTLGPIGGAPDPADVPVRLPDGWLWLLRDDGGKTPAP